MADNEALCPDCRGYGGQLGAARDCQRCNGAGVICTGPEPKTYADGLEAAALYLEGASERLMVRDGLLEKEYRKHAASIRALKE